MSSLDSFQIAILAQQSLDWSARAAREYSLSTPEPQQKPERMRRRLHIRWHHPARVGLAHGARPNPRASRLNAGARFAGQQGVRPS